MVLDRAAAAPSYDVVQTINTNADGFTPPLTLSPSVCVFGQ